MSKPQPKDHPAPFNGDILDAARLLLRERLVPGSCILDPFAGIGRVHELASDDDWLTVGVELEPEWACQSERTAVGDATDLPADWTGRFDAVFTSPCYGNRMADHHKAKDKSKRHTYKHYLGRELTPNSSGAMQWGDDYRAFHLMAWTEAYRVLQPGGWFLLNVKDHPRLHVVQPVAAWHVWALCSLGFVWYDAGNMERTSTGTGFRGRNTTDPLNEWLHLLRKPKGAR